MTLVTWTIGRRVSALVLAVCAVCAAFAAAQEQPPAGSSAGLNGLLNESMPENLSAAIDALPETWKDWGEDLRADLNALHTGQDATVEAQRARLAALRQKADVVANRAADPRYAGGRQSLVQLSGRLSRWLDLLQASLDTLTLDPSVRQVRLQQAQQKLAQSAQQCDGYLRGYTAGEKWTKYLALDTATQVGGSGGGAVPALAQVPAKLRKAEVSPEQREFLQKPVLVAYTQAVQDYVAVAGNVQAAADNDAVRGALKTLLDAYSAYQSEHTKESSTAVRQAYDQLRANSMDGGARMTSVLTTVAFNYNMRLTASETFLNRLVAECRAESGPVRDCILGADVTGCQTTHSQVYFDLLYSPVDVRWDVTARGHVNSNTQGEKCIATIYTHGSHHYFMQKRVIFNGDTFFTEGARISVDANNQTVGARTKLSWVPLLGRLSEGIAMQQAQAKQAQTEAIARQRVASRAVPRMNYEVDQKFGPGGELTAKFQTNVSGRLQAEGLYPDAKQWYSTDLELLGSTRTMGPNELGGSAPAPYPAPVTGVGVQLHESLLDNAADKIGVAGQTMTDAQFREHLQQFFSRLLNRQIEVTPAPQEEGDKTITFVFDEVDPISVRVDDGEILVSLKAGLQREGEEPLPAQILTVRFHPSLAGDKLVMEPGTVSVVAASGMASPMQLAVSVAIKDQIQKKLTRKEYDRVYHLNLENKQVPVSVTSIEAIDGWLVLMAE